MTSPDQQYIPEPQDDVVRDDLPDNDPETDDIDPDEQGVDHHSEGGAS